MIVHCKVSLSEVGKKGKAYPWERPRECARCKNSKVWGHGFVERFFNGFDFGLWLKRWRCPACGLVITGRPEGYWRRFQESVKNIWRHLAGRLADKKWPEGVSRQRGGHWMRRWLSHARGNNLIRKNCEITTLHFYEEKGLAIF